MLFLLFFIISIFLISNKNKKNADDFLVQSLSDIVGGIKLSIIGSYVSAEGNVAK